MLVIIKPNQHDDFYVAWSTMTASPEQWGTRADMLATIAGDELPKWEGWLDSADETSNSAPWPARTWEDDHFIAVRGLGPLARRSQLRAIIETLDDACRPTAATLALLDANEHA